MGLVLQVTKNLPPACRPTRSAAWWSRFFSHGKFECVDPPCTILYLRCRTQEVCKAKRRNPNFTPIRWDHLDRAKRKTIRENRSRRDVRWCKYTTWQTSWHSKSQANQSNLLLPNTAPRQSHFADRVSVCCGQLGTRRTKSTMSLKGSNVKLRWIQESLVLAKSETESIMQLFWWLLEDVHGEHFTHTHKFTVFVLVIPTYRAGFDV